MGGSTPGAGPGGAPAGGPFAGGASAARHAPTSPKSSPVALRALVERAGHGITPEELVLASELGHDGYLDRHLHPASIDDSALAARLLGFPTLGMTLQQIIDQMGTGTLHTASGDLKYAVVLRAVTSKRQLFERVVDTWTDHLSLQHTNLMLAAKTPDDRDVVRAHALGSFGDMIHASARSAAMLEYLDNHRNTKDGPNENYARELMELHTLGVDNGYTEADVKEAARALTGWRYQHPDDGPAGAFVFDGEVHDDGAKTVIDLELPPGLGEGDGTALIDMLVAHPSTAPFIAHKLASRLLVDDPPASVVDRAAAAFVDTGGDLRETIRAVLSSTSFAEAKPWLHKKFRRPLHYAATLLRVTGAELVDPPETLSAVPIVKEIAVLGQGPFDWTTPDGYPDGVEAWGATLLPRWTFASKLLADELPGVSLDVDALVAQIAANAGALGWGRAIGERLATGAFSPTDIAALDAFVGGAPSTATVAEAIALGASSPSFQYY